MNTKKENWFVRHFYWPSSSDAERAEIRERYLAFVQQHAELYESKQAVVSPEIRKYIFRKKKLAVKIFIIFMTSLILGLGTLAVFFPDQLLPAASGLVFIVFGYGGGLYLWHRNLDRPLKENEVRVVQGVVTRKFMEKGCFVELSLKEKIQVMPEDYRPIELGDIIKIEILSEKDMMVKRFITALGENLVYTKLPHPLV